MLDPITAIGVATATFKTIQRAVSVGQDLENVTGQLGKWYSAVSDIRKAREYNSKPPLFKKVFAGGSIEEEALSLLMHEKKIQEMEKDLRVLLNFRYGPNTWSEMIEMRRKIKAQRDREVYRIKEIKRNIIECFTVILCLAVGVSILIGFVMYLMSL